MQTSLWGWHCIYLCPCSYRVTHAAKPGCRELPAEAHTNFLSFRPQRRRARHYALARTDQTRPLHRTRQPTARTAPAGPSSTRTPPTSRPRTCWPTSWARGARPATRCTSARRATAASSGRPCRTNTTPAALQTARPWPGSSRRQPLPRLCCCVLLSFRTRAGCGFCGVLLAAWWHAATCDVLSPAGCRILLSIAVSFCKAIKLCTVLHMCIAKWFVGSQLAMHN